MLRDEALVGGEFTCKVLELGQRIGSCHKLVYDYILICYTFSLGNFGVTYYICRSRRRQVTLRMPRHRMLLHPTETHIASDQRELLLHEIRV